MKVSLQGFSSAALISLALLASGSASLAQTKLQPQSIPHLITFSGSLSGKSANAPASVTFLLYKDQQGGAPLWLETQNVQPDRLGHYAATLGSNTALPADIFASGEARWLAVQPEGESEQPRVLLVAVPYALKAADAETIGGLPPSAFVLAVPGIKSSSTTTAGPSSGQSPATGTPTVDGTGSPGFLPIWTGPSSLDVSALFQSGSGTGAKLGIATQTPAATLDVKGGAFVRGSFTLPASAQASSAAGKVSQPLNFAASAFNSSTAAAVNENFRWQAEPAGNNTSAPAASMNLLFGQGSTAPAETGLSIASNGLITFAAGQTFPGNGTGGITEVAGDNGITGDGTNGKVILALDTNFTDARYPKLSSANQFTGSQNVTGNISATGQLMSSIATGTAPLQVTSTTQVSNLNASFLGGVSAASFPQLAAASNTFLGKQIFNGLLQMAETTATSGMITMNGDPFLHRFGNINSVYLGRGAGNLSVTGTSNVAIGPFALNAATTASANIAIGSGALAGDLGSDHNIAVGENALIALNSGGDNVAIGPNAGSGPLVGINNVYVGTGATGSTNLTNSIAIGAGAFVNANNAMVLGATGTNAIKVGIGTTSPAAFLDVVAGTDTTHDPLAQFGSSGTTNANAIKVYNGSGLTETFIVGKAGQFVTGSAPGDGGLRVNPGQKILFGDSALARMTIDSSGNVKVTGNLSKGGGSFKIDHPLDPLNKYLYHSFVESPDMKNVYDGTITTDKRGMAVVTMPEYFEALNRDFRYQLTVIGQFAQAIVAREITHNRFVIKTNRPSVKVSWQVTGIRQDAYANAHRIPTEEAKPEAERGSYLHPDAFPVAQPEKPMVAKDSTR